jgi:hypothetical protein
MYTGAILTFYRRDGAGIFAFYYYYIFVNFLYVVELIALQTDLTDTTQHQRQA